MKGNDITQSMDMDQHNYSVSRWNMQRVRSHPNMSWMSLRRGAVIEVLSAQPARVMESRRVDCQRPLSCISIPKHVNAISFFLLNILINYYRSTQRKPTFKSPELKGCTLFSRTVVNIPRMCWDVKKRKIFLWRVVWCEASARFAFLEWPPTQKIIQYLSDNNVGQNMKVR